MSSIQSAKNLFDNIEAAYQDERMRSIVLEVRSIDKTINLRIDKVEEDVERVEVKVDKGFEKMDDREREHLTDIATIKSDIKNQNIQIGKVIAVAGTIAIVLSQFVLDLIKFAIEKFS